MKLLKLIRRTDSVRHFSLYYIPYCVVPSFDLLLEKRLQMLPGDMLLGREYEAVLMWAVRQNNKSLPGSTGKKKGSWMSCSVMGLYQRKLLLLGAASGLTLMVLISSLELVTKWGLLRRGKGGFWDYGGFRTEPLRLCCTFCSCVPKTETELQKGCECVCACIKQTRERSLRQPANLLSHL